MTTDELFEKFVNRVAEIVKEKYPECASHINTIRICAGEFGSDAKLWVPEVFERRAQMAAKDVPIYN